MSDDIIYMNGGGRSPLPCARVEALLSEWVDGALASDTRAMVETHLDGCEACADLAADLAALASEARALPQLQPSRDLWAGISERIEAPVVALDAHREAARETTREVRLDPRRVTAAPPRRWWKTVAAAAALVVVTAGVTRQLTVDGARREAQVASATASTAAPVPASVDMPDDTGTAATARPDSGTTPSAAAPATRLASATPRGSGAPRRTVGTTTPRQVPSAGVVPVALPAAAQAYDREIAAMRVIVAERRDELDPRTVRVLERNLKIIDEAIAESHAALAQDPASGLLVEQLTRAMRRKLELLRTVADLPARTS